MLCRMNSKRWLADEVRDVVRVAGDEVVEPDDLVSVARESGRQRCEPRKPAAPVMRTLMLAAPRPIER